MRTAVEQTIQGTQPIIQKKIHSNLVYQCHYHFGHEMMEMLHALDLQIYLGFF
jgi:hypothetical protein